MNSVECVMAGFEKLAQKRMHLHYTLFLQLRDE